MYGFSPAKFCKRLENDEDRYEEVEIQWLLAAWPSYMESIDKKVRYGKSKIYEITKQGRYINCLLMADWYDYRIWNVKDDLAENIAKEIQEEIDQEIVSMLMNGGKSLLAAHNLISPAHNTQYKPNRIGMLLRSNVRIP